jgi:glycosyltransferase involved in cell wall biosynthesis
MPETVLNKPLVSVIIPCYNHGKYISNAIQSAKNQDYANLEIIVVDDGSTDSTRTSLSKHSDIKYIYQENKGPSSARNKGFKASAGKYIVFLDADDVLYPQAISTNIFMLENNPEIAFVSGCHTVKDDLGSIIDDATFHIDKDHYRVLLIMNYIGMNASIMYTRWILDEMSFDPELRGCEDYEHYLRITRKYKVLHHNVKIAEYRKHGENTSSNPELIYDTAIKVLKRQKEKLLNKDEEIALKIGIRRWSEKYIPLIVKEYLLNNKRAVTFEKRIQLLQKYKREILYYLFSVLTNKINRSKIRLRDAIVNIFKTT